MSNDPPSASGPSAPGSKFTLRGLFVLVTCATALTGLVAPLVIYGRLEARKMGCSNNLKSLVLGIHNYESAYKVVPRSFFPHSQLSWTVSLTPFLEASPLYSQISHNTGPYYEKNKNDPFGLSNFATYYFQCPSTGIKKMEVTPPSDVSVMDLIPPKTGEPPYTTHYYGISGAIGKNAKGEEYPLASPLTFEGAPVAGNGIMQWSIAIRFTHITDGLSNTMCFGEMSWESPRFGTRYRSWLHGGTDGSYIAGCRNITRPINSHKKASVLKPFNDMPLGSQHGGGANIGIADGSVIFLSENIDFSVYQALATRNGNETGELQLVH